MLTKVSQQAKHMYKPKSNLDPIAQVYIHKKYEQPNEWNLTICL